MQMILHPACSSLRCPSPSKRRHNQRSRITCVIVAVHLSGLDGLDEAAVKLAREYTKKSINLCKQVRKRKEKLDMSTAPGSIFSSRWHSPRTRA